MSRPGEPLSSVMLEEVRVKIVAARTLLIGGSKPERTEADLLLAEALTTLRLFADDLPVMMARHEAS